MYTSAPPVSSTVVQALKPADPRDQQTGIDHARSIGVVLSWELEPDPPGKCSISMGESVPSVARPQRVPGVVREWEFRERLLKTAPAFDPANAQRLVRELKTAGRDLEDAWHSEVKPAARRLRVRTGDLWGFLQLTWADSTAGGGLDRMDEGMMRADAEPAPVSRRFKKAHDAKAAALAFHLDEINAGGWFPFCAGRVAAWLGVERHAVRRILNRLVKAGLVMLLRDADGKPEWSWKGRRAKEVRWIGPRRTQHDLHGGR